MQESMEFKPVLPGGVINVLDRLNDSGYEAYAVGGCVRDLLMGKQPMDYDVTTSASPEDIKKCFSDLRTVDTGIKYGTVTVISENMPVEVTTYRIDGEYRDNRRPETVTFTTALAEDLKRRDLTINAMAYNPRTGIIDIFGGRTDILNKVIRAIGSPDERFNEDGLRIMRAIRFAACLGFTVEKDTGDAVHRNRFLLENIAGERTAAELNKLICGEYCAGVLREYYDVISVFLPELAGCRGFKQYTRYHDRDVLEHIIATVEAVPPVKHLRLAMLLHDIGKPMYFRMDENGIGHFKGHALGSVQAAARLLERLKYDRETSRKVLTLVETHDIIIRDSEPLIKRCLNRFGEELFFDIIKVHIADDMGKSPDYRDRIPEYRRAAATAERIIRENQCYSLDRLAVNGNDLKSLGLEGREIGNGLLYLLELVIDNKCENERDALLSALKSSGLNCDG